MKKFKNIDDYILNAPHFIIPYDCILELYIAKMRMDTECSEFIDELILEEINKKYNDYKKIEISKIVFIILEVIKIDDSYVVDKKGAIMIDCDDVQEDMIQCDNCGNIWDGCAQCNCNMNPYC